MAIPQTRYIDIHSGEGATSTGARLLHTLVITPSAAVNGKTFDGSNIINCSSALQVARLFGPGSAEAMWADRYFSFRSPVGGTPKTLSFVKKDASESAVAAFKRISGMTSGFGSFTFMTALSAQDISDVAAANSALNYRFLFIAAVSIGAEQTIDELVNSVAVKATPVEWSSKSGYSKGDYVKFGGMNYICRKEIAAPESGKDNEFNEDDWNDAVTLSYNGLHVVFQRTAPSFSVGSIVLPKTYIAAAIVSSIDWTQDDGSVSLMYRQIDGEAADVDDEDDADTLDAAWFNYYGLTQTNGRELSFYQRGMNTDGETSLVYMGEVWLKSEISSDLIDLMLSLPKIPANALGRNRVFATIDAVCRRAKLNGVIEPGKALDSAARASVSAITGTTSAVDVIERDGYWLNVILKKHEDGVNYTARYLLLYGKGDVIIKIEGTDTLY